MGTKASNRFIELALTLFLYPFFFFFLIFFFFPVIKLLKMNIIGIICVLASALTTLGASLKEDDVVLRDALQEFVRAAEGVNPEDLRDGVVEYVSRLLRMDDSTEKLRQAWSWDVVMNIAKKGWKFTCSKRDYINGALQYFC